MKKRYFSIIILSFIFLFGCNSNKNIDKINNDVEILNELFPSMDGIIECKWKEINNETGNFSIGPNEYRIHGIIKINDLYLEKILNEYKWESYVYNDETDKIFFLDEIDVENKSLLYSDTFNENIVLPKYFANIILDKEGNNLFFYVTSH